MKAAHLGIFFAAALVQNAVGAEIPLIDSVKSSGTFSIASGLDYAPFEFVDPNGQPAGLDVDLANAAAKLISVKLDIQRIPFASQIPSLAAGRVKVAWATFTVKEDRLRQVDFVTFLQSGTVAMVLPDKKDSISGAQDLCGMRVAVQTGSAADFTADKLSESCTKSNLPKIEKLIFPEQKDTIQAVLTGRVDARFDDSTAAGYYEQTSKGKLVVAPGVYDILPLGVAVQKGDKATAEMMQAIFQQLIANGEYKAILDKYGMTLAAVEKSRIITSVNEIAE
ncbi:MULTISPECIES: ABC transporter substrate-binding protein [Rhizobium]|uniref:Mimosine-binding periplasmic protein, ABC transporter component n=2 Tax=Rhizobium TaxID=379 RepID=K0PTG4_9HYPH|nr:MULTISPECIES: ABC transporter substrate-binding protein [Rhizobium]KWV43434.1 ABC transporter substrate-binding protein [Rhizobium altiplani]CCM80031.1 Mimosine-binding periplasmic protein, ABC transporter component [Rhizobium mesoamericanum STM3625]